MDLGQGQVPQLSKAQFTWPNSSHMIERAKAPSGLTRSAAPYTRGGVTAELSESLPGAERVVFYLGYPVFLVLKEITPALYGLVSTP